MNYSRAVIPFILFLSSVSLADDIQQASNPNLSKKCELFQADKIEKPDDTSDISVLPLEICIQDVFDTSKPEENGVFFRIANFLHINTKPKYIKQKLLFDAGDDPSEHEMAESERILRKEAYLREASISKTDDKVLVETGDAWTTQPTFSLSHKAGVTTSAIGLKEDNFLGHGFRLSIKQKKDIERDSTEFVFSDTTFLSTEKTIFLQYKNTSDGVYKDLSLSKPFLYLDDNFSYGLDYKVLQQVETYHHNSDPLYNYGADYSKRQVYLGFSNGLHHRRVLRHKFGVGDRYAEFNDVGVFQVNLDKYGIPNSAVITPSIEDEQFAFYEIIAISDDFLELINFRKISSVEDINLGIEFTSKFLIVENSINNERYPETEFTFAKHFLFFKRNLIGLSGSGVFSENLRNRHATSKLFYFFSQTENFKFYSSFSYDYIDEGNTSKQVILDEITGLRGYPLNYRDGTRSGIFTLEQRYYSNYSLWSIVNLGAAVFYDRAYINNEDFGEPKGYYSSIGMGLRFSSNRISDGGLIHFDISRPLNLDDNASSYQVSIELKNQF